MSDPIERQDAINAALKCRVIEVTPAHMLIDKTEMVTMLSTLPSAQPERYTKEELRVFQHGISLRLLSKRSAQHWRYDEDTATEIKFLERLYEKVSADIRGDQDEH